MGTQVYKARISQNPEMTTEESISAGINQTPIGRLGTADEVAKTILFYPLTLKFYDRLSLVVDGA